MAGRFSRRRVLDLKELQTWCAEQGNTCEIGEDCGLTTVKVSIQGPAETPYEGFQFTLNCQLPDTFPLSSPSVAFITRIWHPNVEDKSGAICLDVLLSRWSPVTSLRSVFELYVPELLRCANPEHPINEMAAVMMKSNAKDYFTYAKTHAEKHAGGQSVDLPNVKDMFPEYYSDYE